MSSSEGQFRMGVLGAGALLAITLAYMRFCGDVTLPRKPPPPALPGGTSSQLMHQSAGSESIYMELVARDATTAGIAHPTHDDLAREFTYRITNTRTVLSVGDAPVELAGLRLAVAHEGDALTLAITNTTGSDVAYRVLTQVTPSGVKCMSADPRAHNAIVLAAGVTVTRAECGFRGDLAVAVLAVETMEIPPLSAWYLGQVPPAALGIDLRISRQHVGIVTAEKCAPVMGQALKTLIESGKIGWRDLADFYARHRCRTYQFPLDYRAVTKESPREIPAVREGL